jgi:SAM-dependent methyltransferase
MNYDDPGLPELYDLCETREGDVRLLRDWIASQAEGGCWRVLEPFCGTGRVLLPLARDGHEVTGIEVAEGMLRRLRSRLDDETASPR